MDQPCDTHTHTQRRRAPQPGTLSLFMSIYVGPHQTRSESQPLPLGPTGEKAMTRDREREKEREGGGGGVRKREREAHKALTCLTWQNKWQNTSRTSPEGLDPPHCWLPGSGEYPPPSLLTRSPEPASHGYAKHGSHTALLFMPVYLMRSLFFSPVKMKVSLFLQNESPVKWNVHSKQIEYFSNSFSFSKHCKPKYCTHTQCPFSFAVVQ